MRRHASFMLCLSIIAAAASPAGASSKDSTVIAGIASVSDGDTIKFDGLRVSLWGIDAPENGQKCGKTDAGALAQQAMRTLAQGRRTVCTVRDYNKKNNQPIAQCTVDGQDIGASLVEKGWAWNTRTSDDAYALQESRAKTQQKGVHILSCDKPSAWRAHTEKEKRTRIDKAEKSAIKKAEAAADRARSHAKEEG